MNAELAATERERLLADAIEGKFPDERGRFGPFGGRYVPETLVPALDHLEQGIREHLHTAEFRAALMDELRSWAGRPTPLTFAARLSERWGAQVWLMDVSVCCTAATRCFYRTAMDRFKKLIRSQRGSIIRVSDPSTHC